MKTNTNKNQNKNTKAQSRPEQLSTDKLPKIDFNLRRQHRMLDTEKVLALMRIDLPDFFGMAEVVGKWIWISFPEKQPQQVTMVLSQLGFHWNNARQTWQHPCGTLIEAPATYDPRERYGSYFPADANTA